jgi:hypothetical protein
VYLSSLFIKCLCFSMYTVIYCCCYCGRHCPISPLLFSYFLGPTFESRPGGSLASFHGFLHSPMGNPGHISYSEPESLPSKSSTISLSLDTVRCDRCTVMSLALNRVCYLCCVMQSFCLYGDVAWVIFFKKLEY